LKDKLTRVCVFCGSSTKLKSIYVRAATDLGRVLANEDITVIFGGQKNGLMGALADSVLANQGDILGIIPQFMKREWIHSAVKDKNKVISHGMRDRIDMMLSRSDAVIVLPGGTGTFEELFSVLTLKRLARYNKPIIIIDVLDYFQPFIQLFDKSIEEGFMKKRHKEMFLIVKDIGGIVENINAAIPWSIDDMDDAVV